MPHATPPGTPWNWTAIRLDHRCPIPPGITPGLEDCLRRCPPWNPLDIGRLSARIDVAPLAWYNTRPPGFHLPCSVSGGYIHTNRCCVCVSLRTVSYHPVLCICFREQCLYHLVLCVCFREQFLYHLVLCIFSENSFYTTWYRECS